MIRVILFMLIGGMAFAGEQEPALTGTVSLSKLPEFKITGPAISQSLSLDAHKTITFILSGDGKRRIILSFETGEVEFINCTPPESGKLFWKSVTDAFPEIKKVIAQEQAK